MSVNCELWMKWINLTFWRLINTTSKRVQPLINTMSELFDKYNIGTVQPPCWQAGLETGVWLNPTPYGGCGANDYRFITYLISHKFEQIWNFISLTISIQFWKFLFPSCHKYIPLNIVWETECLKLNDDTDRGIPQCHTS